uniref:hypothetical protein n=1 Tax=Aliarcobacter sp. TaxID=2321116 RepID=UPI00404818BB
MNEEELRKKIYERLGLEFGILSSESGNDWQRAKSEVLDEYKKIEFEKLSRLKTTDYLTLDKTDDMFISLLENNLPYTQNIKSLIAQRKDLNSDEIIKLINDGNKDIIINLTKYQKLKEEHIDKIIENSVYLSKKNLLQYQELSELQRKKLLDIMNLNKSFYSELIKKVEHK